MLKREAVEGGEFDWFAVDGAGHVGHFATAGFGPVPIAVLSRLGDLLELDERVVLLPTVSEATGHLSGHIEDWLEMARRGLFSYDWLHWSGPYRRAATPSVPIQVATLPTELRSLVSVVEWQYIRFVESMALRPEELCPCQ